MNNNKKHKEKLEDIFVGKLEKIILNIYRELYRNCTEPTDFDTLYYNGKFDDYGRIVIPFMDYEIEQHKYNEIIERNLKGKRLSKLDKIRITNTVSIGVSPKFTNF